EPDPDAHVNRRVARRRWAGAAARVAGGHDHARGKELDLFAVEFFDGECVHLLTPWLFAGLVSCAGCVNRPRRADPRRAMPGRPSVSGRTSRSRARGCNDWRLVTSRAGALSAPGTPIARVFATSSVGSF